MILPVLLLHNNIYNITEYKSLKKKCNNVFVINFFHTNNQNQLPNEFVEKYINYKLIHLGT